MDIMYTVFSFELSMLIIPVVSVGCVVQLSAKLVGACVVSATKKITSTGLLVFPATFPQKTD